MAERGRVGLPTCAGDGVMRCAFDELPTTHGGLHDPVVWISMRTGIRGTCPSQASTPSAAHDLGDGFSELRLTAAGEVRGLQRRSI